MKAKPDFEPVTMSNILHIGRIWTQNIDGIHDFNFITSFGNNLLHGHWDTEQGFLGSSVLFQNILADDEV